MVFFKLWHTDWALGAAARVHKPQEIPCISIIVSRLAICSGQKDFGSPLMACVRLLQQKPMSRLFDFTVAWNHGPIKGVETVKGYVRFKSQSQQKWVSGCWADNAKKGVLAFQGQGWCCLCSLSNQQHIVRGTVVKRQCNYSSLDLEIIKGMLWWWWFLPGRLVQWYGIQSKPWNYPETDYCRILKLVFESISTISLCPWTNYILGLGLPLVVQWLRLCCLMQGTCVWPLVSELRSHMPWGNWAPAPQLESLCATNYRAPVLQRKIPHTAAKPRSRQ